MTTQTRNLRGHDDGGAEGLDIPCCPDLVSKPCSDRLRFRYKLPFNPRINDSQVPVDVILVFEYERCSTGMTLGDLQHTLSLLPGESVRLFTADKASRWSFDKESSLAYRHERTSSESHLNFGFAKAVSDLTVSESSGLDTSFDESWAEGGGGASFNFLGLIEVGGGGGIYRADSSVDFARNLSQHAESSSSYVAASVRASRAVSMGEVETRQHAEGESEQHFESGTRRLSNKNRCHAVNYFVWQLMKCQRIRWRLAAIETQVNDPAAPTAVAVNPAIENKLSVVPQAVLATDSNRFELQSADLSNKTAILSSAGLSTSRSSLSAGRLATGIVIDNDLRIAAAAAVNADLEKVGMINNDGTPTKKIIAELSWEKEELIPTGGLVVKGCLDPCNVCEHSLEKEIELDIANKHLRNELLKKQIELLEKHKDYRCCPEGEAEEEPQEG